MSTKPGSGPDAGEYTLIDAAATAYTERFPTCGNTGKVRDHVHRRLIDLPIVGFPTRLHVRLPRYRCITPDCDVKYYQVELVCADSGKRSPPRHPLDPPTSSYRLDEQCCHRESTRYRLGFNLPASNRYMPPFGL